MPALAILAGWLVSGGGVALLHAETIPIPNASFESPTTTYADPRIDAWQDLPKPFWFEETPQNQWDFLTGVFVNPDPTNSAYIDNLDGNQAMFLFAVPEAGVFQDYDSTDWANPLPTHAFDVRFEVGKAYRLTVGVNSAGPLVPGATLLVGLYYRDSASNRVTVAATPIVYTNTVFTNATHFLDFQVNVPFVSPGDVWAGQHIGVQILSTVDPGLANGYWDIDNVRLESFRQPVLSGPTLSNGHFAITVVSDPGLRFEILASSDLAAPLGEWTVLDTVTNSSGSVPFTDSVTASALRFYRARQLP